MPSTNGIFGFACNLAMEEIGVAGVQQPFVLGPHGDAAMAERMAGQRDHQDIRLAIAERAHALEAEPVFAALAVERPVAGRASTDR